MAKLREAYPVRSPKGLWFEESICSVDANATTTTA
ncbi:hypothetical protein HNO88_003733 [Novosphingobium chloroacetimidivorans]|uniref:Uncharacterized protein n=1 Tax=Novosphingobium chloroacetimidivorans TaxID=1428314 RepID=A0A7W7NYM7_9SPHN|nr:hypothetical protein [Novosphingobium chloroacetimidivorans]